MTRRRPPTPARGAYTFTRGSPFDDRIPTYWCGGESWSENPAEALWFAETWALEHAMRHGHPPRQVQE